jgi:hypothetical protein
MYAPQTVDFYGTTQLYTPEDNTHHNNRCVPETQRSSISSILSRVLVTIDVVCIGDRIIDHLQVVTTNNYYTIVDFHTKHSQSTRPCLYLVTALHSGYSSAMLALDVSW